MELYLFLCVSITFLSFSYFSNTSGQSQSQIFKAYFKLYPNITFPGQLFQNATNATRLSCARQCFSNVFCTGYRYGQGGCEMIQDNTKVSNLNFSSNDGVNRKRKIYWRDLSYNPSNMSLYYIEKVNGGVVVGDHIYMRATLVKHGDVKIALAEQLDLINITYEFRARCSTTATCPTKYVTINSCYKGVWNSTSYANIPAYSLSVNETFVYHMLMTSNGMMTFLKNVYLYTLKTIMSVRDVKYIILSANVQLEELSL